MPDDPAARRLWHAAMALTLAAALLGVCASAAVIVVALVEW